LLAAYIAVESIRDLAAGHHPSASWVGIGLATGKAKDAIDDASEKTKDALDGD
jgi:hypothetical protein